MRQSESSKSDFQKGVELFLRIARKRMEELQGENITVRELIDRAIEKHHLSREEAITPSYLSRILTGKLVPKTEETYDKLSLILDIPTLFDVRSFILPHDEGCVHITRKEMDNPPEDWMTLSFGGIPYRTTKANIIDAQMFPFIVELQPGEKTKKGRYKAEAGEEVAVLLEGEEFTLRFDNSTKYIIKKGESLHYLATQPHYSENTGKLPVRILVIRHDPSLFRIISEAFRSAEGKNK